MHGILLGEYPGVCEILINGEEFELPETIRPETPKRVHVFKGGNERATVTGAYDGEGMPDILDGWSVEFDHSISKENAELAATLAILGSSAEPHLVSLGKQVAYTYTLAPGQAVIYLPRRDLYAKEYPNATSARLKATFALAGVDVPVVYQASVEAGTAVTAGQLWISKATVEHPHSRATVHLAKLGTPPGVTTKALLKMFPLYAAFIIDQQTEPGTMYERTVTRFIEAN